MDYRQSIVLIPFGFTDCQVRKDNRSLNLAWAAAGAGARPKFGTHASIAVPSHCGASTSVAQIASTSPHKVRRLQRWRVLRYPSLWYRLPRCSVLHALCAWIPLWHEIRPVQSRRSTHRDSSKTCIRTVVAYATACNSAIRLLCTATPGVVLAEGRKAIEPFLLDPSQPVRLPARARHHNSLRHYCQITLKSIQQQSAPWQGLGVPQLRSMRSTQTCRHHAPMLSVCEPLGCCRAHRLLLIISRRSMSFRSCSGSISSSSFFFLRSPPCRSQCTSLQSGTHGVQSTACMFRCMACKQTACQCLRSKSHVGGKWRMRVCVWHVGQSSPQRRW